MSGVFTGFSNLGNRLVRHSYRESKQSAARANVARYINIIGGEALSRHYFQTSQLYIFYNTPAFIRAKEKVYMSRKCESQKLIIFYYTDKLLKQNYITRSRTINNNLRSAITRGFVIFFSTSRTIIL